MAEGKVSLPKDEDEILEELETWTIEDGAAGCHELRDIQAVYEADDPEIKTFVGEEQALVLDRHAHLNRDLPA